MERHNNYSKFNQYSKVITWQYVISGAGIVILPFLSTGRANIQGYESPYTYAFAAVAAIGLILFGWRYFKNENYCVERDVKLFNAWYPGTVAVIALIIFLVGEKFFVDEYIESGKQSLLSVAVCGEARELAFWWGPFIYCVCMAVASYFTFLLNEVTKELKNGIE